MKKIRLSYVISLLLAFVCTPSLLAQDSGKAEYTEGKTEFIVRVTEQAKRYYGKGRPSNEG